MSAEGQADPKTGRFLTGNTLSTGRPKGARSKLGEDFLLKLQTDFEKHGEAVIATVRDKKPAEYLKVVASLLPKQVEIKEGAFDGVSDEQLAALVVAARSALTASTGSGSGGDTTSEPEPAEGLPAVH